MPLPDLRCTPFKKIFECKMRHCSASGALPASTESLLERSISKSAVYKFQTQGYYFTDPHMARAVHVRVDSTIDFSSAGDTAIGSSARTTSEADAHLESAQVFGVRALAGRANTFGVRWSGMVQATGPSEGYWFRFTSAASTGKVWSNSLCGCRTVLACVYVDATLALGHLSQ